MGKQNRSRNRRLPSAEKNSTARPRVLFAVGDADWKYTRGKFLRLVARVAAESRFAVSVVSHDAEICQDFDAAGIEAACLPGSRVCLTPEHTVAMTELMIKLTRDIVFPDSRLHVWKVMAMDDYLGSIDMVFHPPLASAPDLVVCPLMGVDNNSTDAAQLYSSVLLQAGRLEVPVVGLEVSLLGNKQTLGAALADTYAVKTESSRAFVLREQLAAEEQAFVLPPDEAYLLTCRDDIYLDDFYLQEDPLRRRLGISRGELVVFIPHHVAFIYEIRELLRGLKSLSVPVSVILRTDPNTARQGLKEIEIAEKVYREEINALPHVIVDDQGGWLWSLLLSDIVLAPAHSVFTELGAAYGKFTVICQGWGENQWVSENLFIEPRPQQALGALRGWIQKQIRSRRNLACIIAAALESTAPAPGRGAHHGA
jgi:hypothetical protein